MKKIFWLVGENSGDLHASLIMRRVNLDIRDIQHIGIGGSRMQVEGLTPLFNFERFAVMGFLEVVQHLFFFLKVERVIKKLFKKDKPDLVILVDYPGLNLRIARIADDAKIPVLYFICPQFWAWKHNRVYDLKENVRHVACILPFEKELLDIHNVPCSYVGHPIAEEVQYEVEKADFARFYGLNTSKKWIGFFPGSRNSELHRMLPVFLESLRYWDSSEYEFLFSKARTVSHQHYLDLLDESKDKKATLIDGYTYEMMKYCDLLIVTSGTATLEAAYIGTPMLIVYKTSNTSYQIGRRLVRIKRIGLPNIILDDDVLPELVQKDVNAKNLHAKAMDILNSPERYKEITDKLSKIKHLLGEKKASVHMSRIIKELLKIDV